MKVVLVQQGFKSGAGHYLLETRAWREAVLGAGHTWQAYGHIDLDPTLAKEEAVVPLFPFASDAVVDSDALSRSITDLLFLSEQWAHAARLMPEIGASDLVIVAFASEREVYGVARWLRLRALAERPRVAFLFHGPDPAWTYDAQSQVLSGPIDRWRFAMNQLRASLPVEKLFLGATNARLATFLSHIFDVPTQVSPLVSLFDAELLLTRGPVRFDLLVAGGPRKEKGTEMIAALFEQLARFAAPLRVGVQVDSVTDQDFLNTHFGRTAGPLALDIVLGPLPPATYLQRLNSTRLLLLAYDATRYRLRASGIASEAFGYGIPIIAPAHCWIGEQLDQELGSGVQFTEWHAASIASAVRSALDQWPQLQHLAQQRAANWRAQHSAAVALSHCLQSLAA